MTTPDEMEEALELMAKIKETMSPAGYAGLEKLFQQHVVVGGQSPRAFFSLMKEVVADNCKKRRSAEWN